MGEAAAEFTDTRSSCRILLTSYQCGAHGLILHAECSRVILLEPPLNPNTLFQAVARVHRLGQRSSQKVWSIVQEHTISRWIECNNTLKALPQFSAQLHDLLKPVVMAAQAKDDSEDDEAADQAEAEVIQQIAVDCLRHMLGQTASRLNVKDLDDLSLPQRGLDQMEACMTPRGRKRERARQDSPTEGRAGRKRTKATASEYKSADCVISDSEVEIRDNLLTLGQSTAAQKSGRQQSETR
ncbi:hypothetical protein CNMCM8980_000506 [Aspergillus fumigatiaffinis]|nr:hypothetical protein CNMCM8980_000506 [Aspergillus fumigatiaffinis]